MSRIESLTTFIESHKDKPFSWGETDCCMFAADWVKELTGRDYAASFRGKYSDEAGAKRELVKAGGLVPLISGMLGEPLNPLVACRGDIVWGEYENGPACGIMAGHAAAFMCDDGVAMKPLDSLKGCWHV